MKKTEKEEEIKRSLSSHGVDNGGNACKPTLLCLGKNNDYYSQAEGAIYNSLP